jgi:hypothetical protein
MKKHLKRILIIFIALFSAFLVFICFLFFVRGKPAENITFGVNFSQKQAGIFRLDWKEVYTALLDDLGAKKIKLAVHWNLIEPKKEEYYFDDLDWQTQEAEKKNVQILLAIGMKTPRWPECHIPDWAKDLTKEEQQDYILKMIGKVVSRYQNSDAILGWQVENEPFFPFGECPWIDKEFLKKEISLVKSLDKKNRPVIISDSGEGSLWVSAAKTGDIVGTTMYRKVWFDFSWLKIKFSFMPNSIKKIAFYLDYDYIFPPNFYRLKAEIIEKLFHKKVVCVELQTEPWCQSTLYDCPIEEQEKTMNLDQFKRNIEFAKSTGFSEFYLWGGEWLYWMKAEKNHPEFWEEAKRLF